MSQFIKFYFTSSMLKMFRILIHTPSGACDSFVLSPHWQCVLISTCVGVSVWLVRVVSVQQAEEQLQASTFYTDTTPTSHTETPTHIEIRTHNQCDDTTEKSQAPDDGCINIRNMLNIEEVKSNLITSDIKLVSYSPTITMMHGPIYVSQFNVFHPEVFDIYIYI